MPLLEHTLAAVLAQECDWPFDVLVVDSESTDGSWELAGSLGVERLRVRRAEFNHGSTRNAAARQVRGVHVVFLVQDAVPADRAWLRTLVAAAGLPGAAASYSRQLPQPDATGVARLYTEAALPQGSEPVVQRLLPEQAWETLTPAGRFARAAFRNNSSCIRRSVLIERPFRALPYGEDLEWGQRVVREGLALVYEPASMVYHSHDRSSWYEFKRAYADHALVVQLFDYRVYPSARALAMSWMRQMAALERAAWREPIGRMGRLRLAGRVVAVTSARHAGSWLGARAGARRLSAPLDRVLRRGI
jgi:rhamnosyltransferase